MPGGCVLIVEDDFDGQEVITYIVQALNLQVETTTNAEEAMRLLDQNGAYHAAIIDLALPGKHDGLYLLTHLRRDQRFQYMPCIAITAFHNSKLREHAMQAGFNAYFPKPLNPSLFIKELEQLF